jgi:hypothetical protein
MTPFDPSQIPWRTPWHAIAPDRGARVEAELHREMDTGHVLFGRSVQAIGCRQDCDDVLFYLGESEPGFAVVHLTYQRETSPEWPSTVLFATLAEWVEQCLIPDAEDFDA